MSQVMEYKTRVCEVVAYNDSEQPLQTKLVGPLDLLVRTREVSGGERWGTLRVWCQCPMCKKMRRANLRSSLSAEAVCQKCGISWPFFYRSWKDLPQHGLTHWEDVDKLLCPKCWEVRVEYYGGWEPDTRVSYDCECCKTSWGKRQWAQLFKVKPDFLDEETWKRWVEMNGWLANQNRAIQE